MLVKDQIVEGVISSITNFGAFVKVGEVTGLVHISEVSVDFVKNISDVYKVGDIVKVKVIRVEDGGKYVLSIKKAVLEERAGADRPSSFIPEKKPNFTKSDTFEEKLAKFLKDSEEIQLDARRSQDLSRKKKRRIKIIVDKVSCFLLK